MKEQKDLLKAYNEQFDVNSEEYIDTANCCCCDSIAESCSDCSSGCFDSFTDCTSTCCLGIGGIVGYIIGGVVCILVIGVILLILGVI